LTARWNIAFAAGLGFGACAEELGGADSTERGNRYRLKTLRMRTELYNAQVLATFGNSALRLINASFKTKWQAPERLPFQA